MSWKSYSAGQTGEDKAGFRDEKPVRDNCPQRGTRPDLDLSPSNDFGDFSETHLPDGDFYNKFPWKDDHTNAAADYDDKPAIDNNEAVPQRRDWDFQGHGWRIEPSEALPSGESGRTNKASNVPGSVDKPRGARG